MFKKILECPKCKKCFDYEHSGQKFPDEIECSECGSLSPSVDFNALLLCSTCRSEIEVPLELFSEPDLRCPKCNEPLSFEEDELDELLENTVATCAENSLEEKSLFKAGDFFDKYRIIKLLGKGGMGEVYLAEHLLLKKRCALKLMRQPKEQNDAVFVKRFIREAKLSHSLDHPNIVKVFDAGSDYRSGFLYIAMEYVEGKTLQSISEKKIFSEDKLLELINIMTFALKDLEKKGIVHRDIKPSNIMLTNDGVYKLMDLGIAKVQSGKVTGEMTLTMEQSCIGTPGYASPEQCQASHQVDIRSDIYSLGVTIYNIASGAMPYDGDTPLEVIINTLQKEPKDLSLFRPDLSPRFLALIRRMIAKDKKDRPGSIGELQQLLLTVENGSVSVPEINDKVSISGPSSQNTWFFRSGSSWRGKFGLGAIIFLLVSIAAIHVVYVVDYYGRDDEKALTYTDFMKSFFGFGKKQVPVTGEGGNRQQENGSSAILQQFQSRYNALETLLTEVQKMNFSPGRTFEQRKEELETHCRNAKEAAGEKNYYELGQSLTWAESAARWIRENRSLCEKAAQLASSGAELRKSAETFESANRVPDIWKKASEYSKTAQKQYDSGDFRSAVQNFEKAAFEYRNAGTQAQKIYLEELIRQAQNAVAKQDWEKAAELSKKILPFDKSAAERLLKSIDNARSVERLISEWEKALNEGKIEEAFRLQESVPGRAKTNPRILELKEKLIYLCRVENEKLQESVALSRVRIRKAAYSRGQGFEKYLEILEKRFTEGVAKKRSDPIAACKLLKEAETAAAWIFKNVPLRLRAEKKLEQVTGAKAEVDKFYTGAESVAEYKEASSFYTQGKEKYDSGEFTAAIQLLEKALSGYDDLRGKLMAGYEKKLLKSASEAVGRRNWEELKKIVEELNAIESSNAGKFSALAENGWKIEKWFAEAENFAGQGKIEQAVERLNNILKLDENHKEALRFKERIEVKQQVGVAFAVYFNGVKVPGRVSLDGEHSFATGEVYKRLKKGRRYTGTVSYKGDSRKIAFVCNWDGIKIKEYFLGSDSALKKYRLPNGTVLNMVRISAGSFMMGTVPGREKGQNEMESPQHKVTINSDFWIGETEVTQEQYRSVMRNNPSWVKGENHPVTGVSWLDARRFCQRLTRYCSKQLPEGYKFDLPTEAQWEYACRAGTQTALNNGKVLSALTERCYYLDDIAWYKFNSHSIMPVKRKVPNAWGIYDMHGNVAEWCLDYYGFYEERESVDPAGVSSGRYRVYRGGSWEHAPEECRSASRFGGDPRVEQKQNIGFRVVIVPQ